MALDLLAGQIDFGAYWFETVVKVGVAAALVPVAGLVLGYVFLFKMMSAMQSRKGPMEAGPQGSLQLLADGIKFFQKEDIIPAAADKLVFKLAPFVVLASTFMILVVVPAGPDLVVEPLDVGIFYALAVSSLSVIGVLMAGWSSANKYALLGGLRAAGQLIAYELPLVLAVVGVVIQAGTMSLTGIVESQYTGEIFGWGALGNPFVITQFIGFFIFLVAVQAELAQTPFDMPVAETEIVGGYHVEYTGFRFLLFFLGEFATAFAFAALAAVLFLGGWTLPPFIIDLIGIEITSGWMNVIGPIVLFAKIMLVAFLIFWVRFSYPRLREDQLQAFSWKFLVELSLANIVLTAILKVVF
jgi:NADH-quinone oxidoreductase subunit H